MFPCFKRTPNQVKSNQAESPPFIDYPQRTRLATREQGVAWFLWHEQMKRISQKRGHLREVGMSMLEANVLKDILGPVIREAKGCLVHPLQLGREDAALRTHSHRGYIISINGKDPGQIFAEITQKFLESPSQSSKEPLSSPLSGFAQLGMITRGLFRWSSEQTLVQEAASMCWWFWTAALPNPWRALPYWTVASTCLCSSPRRTSERDQMHSLILTPLDSLEFTQVPPFISLLPSSLPLGRTIPRNKKQTSELALKVQSPIGALLPNHLAIRSEVSSDIFLLCLLLLIGRFSVEA